MNTLNKNFDQQTGSSQQAYNNKNKSDGAEYHCTGDFNEQVDELVNAFENIFSTNLEDLIEFSDSDDNTTCEVTEQLIADAMLLSKERKECRLKEIHQHVRFMKGQEKRKKIIGQKSHRPFDDSNIGLCSVCLDDNFQIVHPMGKDMACDKCFQNTM